jgi:hypothetical protein
MARYIWVIQGCEHKFKSRQEALDYMSFDRFFESMSGGLPKISIISRYTPTQYKRMLEFRAKLSVQSNHTEEGVSSC